jgi:UDP-N-acetylmuramoyl-tripeptide--D-alanyl-D-alanine ligase
MRLTVQRIAELIGGVVEGDPSCLVVGAEVDSRLLRPGELFVALPGDRCDGHDFVATALEVATAALVRRSAALEPPPPGRALVRVDDPLSAYHQLARRDCAGRRWTIVAVTGSVAKTTTKDYIAHLIAAHARAGASEGTRNSTLGLPAQLLRQPDDIEVFVAEAGMSRPGELDLLGAILQPDVLLYTRIAPAHTEFFAGLAGVVEAKAELLGHLKVDGALVLNADDPYQQGFSNRVRARVLRYGAGQAFRLDGLEDCGLAGTAFDLVTPEGHRRVALDLPGRHQADNLLAATAAAAAIGVPLGEVAARVSGLRAAPRRGRLHRRDDGVTIVDDSYNASPVAMSRLLELLRGVVGGRRIAVLGEMYELGAISLQAHRQVGEEAARAADLLIAVGGEAATELAAAAGRAGLGAVFHSADRDAATRLLAPQLEPGDVVLVKGSRGVGLDATVDALLGQGRA